MGCDGSCLDRVKEPAAGDRVGALRNADALKEWVRQETPGKAKSLITQRSADLIIHNKWVAIVRVRQGVPVKGAKNELNVVGPA